MPHYATLQNLKDRLPDPLDTGRETYAQTLLDDAAAIITDTIPALDTRLTYDTGALRDRLIRVCCQMVARVLSNPNGYLTETIDDYTYRRDSAVSAGRLYLADDELAELSPVGTTSGAFTIRPR